MNINECRPTLIAEIGINHEGDLQKAKDLIRQAKIAGWDYAKFQKYTLDLFVPEQNRNKRRPTPFGEMSAYEYRKRLDFNREQWDELFSYANTLGISFVASAFDAPAFEFLRKYEMDFIKIPSCALTDTELLQAVKASGMPFMLSTGMSEEKDIEYAVQTLGEENTRAILHCISSYPTKTEDVNLRNIPALISRFWGVSIGYSGHEVGFIPTLGAVALGADVLERHITLDKVQKGTDIPCSLDLADMILLRRWAIDLTKALGDWQLIVRDCEKPALEKLRLKTTI